MTDSRDFSEIDCDHVVAGVNGRVLMERSVTKEFLLIESAKQARLLANAKLWADGHKPHSEQFQGNEGRCGGENDRMLAAVKTKKVRLYGFIRQYRGSKCLIIVSMDSDKKQYKANPRSLKKAYKAVQKMDIKCGE